MNSSKRGTHDTAVIKSNAIMNKDTPVVKSNAKEITPQVKRTLEIKHINSGISLPKKRTCNRTIEDCINTPQTAKIVRCPICKMEVLFSEINNHLDGFHNNSGIPENECEKGSRLCLKIKQKTSAISTRNKKSIDSLKSLKEINIKASDGYHSENILSQKQASSETLSESLSKPTSAPCSQQLISSKKCTDVISIDGDEEEDILQGLSNELAKPLLNDVDSDDNEMKSALNEQIGNDKTNEWDNYENDNHEGMEFGVNADPTISGTSEVVKETEENLSEDGNEVTIEQRSDPYYLANFKLVLDTVLSNEEDRNLFNDEDQQIIKQFQDFPTAAQKLYIRLFQRKPGWFRCLKLDYPKIAGDLNPVLKQLVDSGFLYNEKRLTDLKEVLQLLPVSDLRELAKSRHINAKSTQQKGQNKQFVIDSLIKHAVSQKTLFGNGSALLLKKAKEVLGPCVCVSSDPKSVFSRLLLLFSMNIIPEDEDNKYNGQSQQLSTLMLVNMGRLAYPDYNIIRQVPIFKDRDHMIKFAEAYQEKHDMSVALEVTGDLEAAYSFYPKAAKCFKGVLSSLKKRKKSFSSSLPIHLRCFTAEWVYTKMCYLGVEVLQKKRMYEEAVQQLELLLQQDTYCADCRGLWWERLALNVHQHLKKPNKALQIIHQGLEDSHVRFGRRLALIQRAKKILSSASFNKNKKNDEDTCDINEELLVEPHPAESVTISGKRSADLGVFITHEVTKTGQVKEDSMAFLAVEEYALSHYRQQGYDEGIHGETSTFTTLYGLFFWDILFLDGIPDVFRGKFQAAPLDIQYDTFYTKRKELIDQRLQDIKTCSDQDLTQRLEHSWVEHEGQTCSGVSWERFEDVEQAKQLVSCISGKVLSGVFKHFAQDMRHWHSGMPDLVVWSSSSLLYKGLTCGLKWENITTKLKKIVEVKGPGDRLSTKQQMWLHELASFGATVEVCYVTAVGGKKLVKTK